MWSARIAVVLLCLSIPSLKSQQIEEVLKDTHTITAELGETKTVKAVGQAAEWGCYIDFSPSDKDHSCCYQTKTSSAEQAVENCKEADNTWEGCRKIEDISVKETDYCEFTLNGITDNDFGDYSVVFLKHSDSNKLITVQKSSGGGWVLPLVIVGVIAILIIGVISIFIYHKKGSTNTAIPMDDH